MLPNFISKFQLLFLKRSFKLLEPLQCWNISNLVAVSAIFTVVDITTGGCGRLNTKKLYDQVFAIFEIYDISGSEMMPTNSTLSFYGRIITRIRFPITKSSASLARTQIH